MNYNCLNCGGEVKTVGRGFKCICCGTVYDSAEELKPKPIVRPIQKPRENNQSQVANENSGVNVFDKNINGVLEITWSDGTYCHSGSGFLIDKSGYAITNAHVVTRMNGGNAGKISAKLCGENSRVEIVKLGDSKHGYGSGVDLALIKLSYVPSKASVVQFADSNTVKNGESVYVIGNSLGYGTCITKGIVSDNCRDVDNQNLIMTDCAVNGGNSGGPMFNEKGLAIGVICSGIIRAEGMNYAIPSNSVLGFLKESEVKLEARKALAPCPKCGSWETDVENGIFYCHNCGFEG